MVEGCRSAGEQGDGGLRIGETCRDCKGNEGGRPGPNTTGATAGFRLGWGASRSAGAPAGRRVRSESRIGSMAIGVYTQRRET